jgi:hypothetical protein
MASVLDAVFPAVSTAVFRAFDHATAVFRAFDHASSLASPALRPVVIPALCLWLAFCLYCTSMFIWRVWFERRTVVRAPSAVGYAAHEAEVARVVAQFRGFLQARAPGQLVTLQVRGAKCAGARVLRAATRLRARARPSRAHPPRAAAAARASAARALRGVGRGGGVGWRRVQPHGVPGVQGVDAARGRQRARRRHRD